MKEIKDKSIDFIFTSPPYNLETKYDGFKDSLSFKDYKKMLSKIICECSRVIKNNSLFIVEVADSVIFKNKYVLLAGLIQSICLKNSFFLAGRYINFINTNHKVEIPDHNIKKDFSNNGNAHSNCHQILIFSKTKFKIKLKEEIIYFNYKESKDHNCPFPKDTVNFVLDKYYHKNFNVLDPFMGVAILGEEVIKRKGDFYGYEISKIYYTTALQKLESIFIKN